MANVYFDSIRTATRKERQKNKFLSNRIGVSECILETLVNYLQDTVNLPVDPDTIGNDENGIPYFIFSDYYQTNNKKYNEYDYSEREQDITLELFHIIRSVVIGYMKDCEITVDGITINKEDGIYERME